MREPGMVMSESDAAEYLKGTKRYTSAYEQLNNMDTSILNQYNSGVSELHDIADSQKQNLFTQYGTNRYFLGSDFSNNADKAFQTAQLKESVMNPQLSAGMRGSLQSDLEKATTAAYDSYIKNYYQNRMNLDANLQSGRSDIENQLAQGIGTLKSETQSRRADVQKSRDLLDQQLLGEAAIWGQLFEAPEQYLRYLVDEGIINETSAEFGKFFIPTYENGEESFNLMTDDAWDAMMYENGELTQAGKDFYQQILMGTDNIEGVPGFNAWLNTTNPDLYSYYLSNGNEVFGQADIDLSPYKGDKTKVYDKPQPDDTFTDSKDFGTVRRFTGDAGDINIFDSLKLSGANFGNISDDKSENFTAKYTDEDGVVRKYDMKISKNATLATDDILKDIRERTGSIEDGKLYEYSGILYLAENKDGTVKLREVTFRDDKSRNAFFDTLGNETELRKTRTSTTPTTPTTFESPEQYMVNHFIDFVNPFTAGTPNLNPFK